MFYTSFKRDVPKTAADAAYLWLYTLRMFTIDENGKALPAPEVWATGRVVYNDKLYANAKQNRLISAQPGVAPEHRRRCPALYVIDVSDYMAMEGYAEAITYSFIPAFLEDHAWSPAFRCFTTCAADQLIKDYIAPAERALAAQHRKLESFTLPAFAKVMTDGAGKPRGVMHD